MANGKQLERWRQAVGYVGRGNEEIRDVINTLTSKSVLILGCFSIPERKSIKAS